MAGHVLRIDGRDPPACGEARAPLIRLGRPTVPRRVFRAAAWHDVVVVDGRRPPRWTTRLGWFGAATQVAFGAVLITRRVVPDDGAGDGALNVRLGGVRVDVDRIPGGGWGVGVIALGLLAIWVAGVQVHRWRIRPDATWRFALLSLLCVLPVASCWAIGAVAWGRRSTRQAALVVAAVTSVLVMGIVGPAQVGTGRTWEMRTSIAGIASVVVGLLLADAMGAIRRGLDDPSSGPVRRAAG